MFNFNAAQKSILYVMLLAFLMSIVIVPVSSVLYFNINYFVTGFTGEWCFVWNMAKVTATFTNNTSIQSFLAIHVLLMEWIFIAIVGFVALLLKR